ncbi:unnamed protein product [Pleuronectes platessa]|uniref:Uncharacterized protein n=1 Tax=Pleuronectes platessa TaxID=8262 RepID=A0A9N7UFG6_PLEPL|nr:unnamed protein product [Pleuronectes platessa]
MCQPGQEGFMAVRELWVVQVVVLNIQSEMGFSRTRCQSITRPTTDSHSDGRLRVANSPNLHVLDCARRKHKSRHKENVQERPGLADSAHVLGLPKPSTSTAIFQMAPGKCGSRRSSHSTPRAISSFCVS